MSSKTTVVVGAGIIGASIAYELQKRGRNVVMVDGNAPGQGASFGNMASVAVTEFMPLARMSTWRHMPGWLIDPEGPVSVSPKYFPRLIPWFSRFILASNPSTVQKLECAGAELCQRSLADTEELLAEIDGGVRVSKQGCLSLYANDREFAGDRERIEMLHRHGFDYEIIEHSKIRDLEPEISDKITKAVLLPDNRTLTDPYQMVVQLVARFKALGGQVQQSKVTGFKRGARISGVHLQGGTFLEADNVVLCAGAFTGGLSKLLGEPIPLETERGYHTQIMAPDITIKHSIIWPAKAFMVSPTAGGIRVGGTVELAGLNTAPNYKRAKITVKHARKALPNLKIQNTSEWMGHRPALPDTIPVMSPSAKTPGVFYATGHGHLGMTYAATTAKLMGQLICGERPDIDLSPYSVTRF
jgi:D-amino-acid dehydrogenase